MAPWVDGRWWVTAALAMTGCGIDFNANGIGDGYERGQDDNANGIADRFEAELHAQDADGDGYSDLVEFERGTDPQDAESVVYQGGWPALAMFEQDALARSWHAQKGPFGFSARDYVLEDSHGDAVSIWDMGADEKPILMVLRAEWCMAGTTLLACVMGGPEELCPDNAREDYAPLKVALDRDLIRMVVVMVEDETSEPATQATIARVDATFPHTKVPMLMDPTYATAQDVGVQYWPTTYLLNPRMELVAWDVFRGDLLDVVSSLVEGRSLEEAMAQVATP